MPGFIAHVPNREPKYVPLQLGLFSGCIREVHQVVLKAVVAAFELHGDSDNKTFHEQEMDHGIRLMYKERSLDEEISAKAFVESLKSGFPCAVRVLFRLLGGKGGFGALLRGQKGGKKTRNFDAMRDLSGRRLRHAKAVERIKDWMENKKRDDELVEALKGEGPELPKVPEASETLSEDYISQLKRQAILSSKLVSEGMRQTEDEDKVDANGGLKRQRAEARVFEPGWQAAFDPLVALSPDSENGSGAEDVQAPSAAVEAASSAATPAAPVRIQEVRISSQPATPEPQAAASSSHSNMQVQTLAMVEAIEPLFARATAAESKIFEAKVLTVSALAAYSSAEDLESRESAETIKKSLQALGLKCGGRPKERVERLFLLRTRGLKDLPGSVFAKK